MTADYFALYAWIACGAFLAYHSLKRLWLFFTLRKASFPYDIPIFWGLIVLEYWYSFSQPRGFLDLRIVEFFLWSTGTVLLYLIFLGARRRGLKKRLSHTEPSKVTGATGATREAGTTAVETPSMPSTPSAPSTLSAQPHCLNQTHSTQFTGQTAPAGQPAPQKLSTPQRVLILPQSPPLPTPEEDSPQ